jgi:hypothetical protein
MLHPDGYARRLVNYDARGNSIEEAYVDFSGDPVVHRKLGFSRMRQRFDTQGNLIARFWFGSGGVPSPLSARYAYDARGNRIEELYVDDDERPFTVAAGFAKIRYQYDTRGDQILQSYYDSAGRPARSIQGYASVSRAYNALGKLIEEAYFDVGDRPTLSVDRYAKVRWKYDNRSNKTEEAYFGIDDRPTRSKQGYLKIVWVYDALGNVIDTQHVTAQADEPIQREHSAVDNAVRQ